jgi:hypothetical protein
MPPLRSLRLLEPCLLNLAFHVFKCLNESIGVVLMAAGLCWSDLSLQRACGYRCGDNRVWHPTLVLGLWLRQAVPSRC